MAIDATVNQVWVIPYRDYPTIENTINNAQAAAAQAFVQYIGASPRVREGYWYDLQEAGASAYSGSNELLFASSTNKYGFPYAVTLSITIPQAKTFCVYGIADYSPSPALQAFQLTQNDVNFPLVYLSPQIYTNADHRAVLNGNFPAIQQNQDVTLTLYGTAAQTDKIDVLFEVAEQSAKTS